MRRKIHVSKIKCRRLVKQVKVILIDDEEKALAYFEYQLNQVAQFEIVGKFTNPLEGKQAINDLDVDLVFLDIQIPEMNGMELAERLLEKQPSLPIVFVTAYDEYAIQAFELNALDYLLKPVSKARLLKTVKRIQKEQMKSHSQLVVKDHLKLHLFQQVELYYKENDNQTIIPITWRTAKAEQLFLYLLHHRGQLVNKAFLVELLWSTFDYERGFQQLYTTIYYIRQTLKDVSMFFTIKSMGDDYMLQVNHVEIDVEVFETIVNLNMDLSEKTIQDYEKALTLYRGDYLEKYDYIWAEGERHRRQLQWLNMAHQLVEWYSEQNELNKALELSFDICDRFPLEEEAYFQIMKLSHELGDYPTVRQKY